jgi:hypothetical protein
MQKGQGIVHATLLQWKATIKKGGLGENAGDDPHSLVKSYCHGVTNHCHEIGVQVASSLMPVVREI